MTRGVPWSRLDTYEHAHRTAEWPAWTIRIPAVRRLEDPGRDLLPGTSFRTPHTWIRIWNAGTLGA